MQIPSKRLFRPRLRPAAGHFLQDTPGHHFAVLCTKVRGRFFRRVLLDFFGGMAGSISTAAPDLVRFTHVAIVKFIEIQLFLTL